VAARDEGPGPGPGWHPSVGPLEQDVERLEDFAAVAVQVAEPAQPRRQSQAGLGTVRISETEGQRGTDVVELDVQPAEPNGLVGAAQVQVGGLGQSQVVIAVGGAGFVRFGACPHRETFGGVVADRLKQPIAGTAVQLFGLDQALVDQGGQAVQHQPFSGVISRGDRLGRLQGPASGEDRQLAEHDLLLGIEQVVGPVDQGAEGLMAGQGRTAPPGQQPEPLIEPGADLRHRERTQPGRGELEGQRDPVQADTDRRHRRGVGGVDGEALPVHRRPLRE